MALMKSRVARRLPRTHVVPANTITSHACSITAEIEEGMKELTIAADAGYRQAIFVLGYIYADGKVKHDDCRAGTLFLRGVALEHPWSGASRRRRSRGDSPTARSNSVMTISKARCTSQKST
ncbi:MAG: hypothetical protein R3F24_10020 [Gammaproteobacteria bacterium]